MQFLAVPGEVTLIRLILPSPSLSEPSLPAAITKQKSLAGIPDNLGPLLQYHGEHGFRTFTLDKPVFVQRRFAPSRLLHPPYGAAFERVLRVLKRL